MNLAEYYFKHVIPTGWRTIGSAFRVWKDLMTDNYADYALLVEDDPLQECLGWFWVVLGEDNVYPKAFLEDLQELVRRVDAGEVDLVPFESIKGLLGDLNDVTEEE